MKNPMLQQADDRRNMPSIVTSNQIKEISNGSDTCILASGNLDYFIKYGIPLAHSHQKTSQTNALIFNCIDFSMTLAATLLKKANILSPNISFTKTTLDHRKNISQEEKICYYKTIRFEVAKRLQAQFNVATVIIDIDALFTGPIKDVLNEANNERIDIMLGSKFDLCNKTTYEASRQDYLWRTIKAGFSYFNNSRLGKEALSRICEKLFNYNDSIPPIDPLKLYRAYYGDQLSLLLTLLEYKDAPPNKRPKIKCIGYSEKSPINFSVPNKWTRLWIPPASFRNEKLFKPENLLA